MNHSFKKLILINALLALSFFPFQPIKAQAFCSGSDCSNLPVTTADLNTLVASIKYQFGDILAGEMSRASAAANPAGIPMGSHQVVDHITIGTSLSLGYEEKHNITIVSPYGVITGIDSGGYAAVPHLFVGGNLDRIINWKNTGSKSNIASSSPFALKRFNVYLTHFNQTLTEGSEPEFDVGRMFVLDQQRLASNPTGDPASFFNFDPIKGLRFTDRKSYALKTDGFLVRYRIADNDDVWNQSWIEWLGASVGFGYTESLAHLEIIEGQKDLAVRLGNGKNMVWNSFAIANYNVHAKSWYLEVSSGLQWLYFLNTNLAVGFAYNQGHLKLSYTRLGNAYIPDDNLFSILGSTDNSFLGAYVESDAKLNPLTYYLKPGITFDFPYFKIDIEGIITREAEGLSLAMRLEF